MICFFSFFSTEEAYLFKKAILHLQIITRIQIKPYDIQRLPLEYKDTDTQPNSKINDIQEKHAYRKRLSIYLVYSAVIMGGLEWENDD